MRIFLIGLFLSIGGQASAGPAILDVNEVAGKAIVGYVSISSSVYVDISSNTFKTTFAYNICNEDSTNKIRCGYTTSVSTIAANVNLGFWVKPQECEYRAVGFGITPYCMAEGSSAIAITREIFGKNY